MDLEAKNPGHVPCPALLRNQGWVDLEEDIVERGAEVGAIDGGVSGRLRVVDVLTLGAVHLDRLLVREIGLAHREQGVGVADDAGAFAEVGFLVFVELEGILDVRDERFGNK